MAARVRVLGPEALRNARRLRRWRERWLLVTGRAPDQLAHRIQRDLGLQFPLPGRWPSYRELLAARLRGRA